MTPGLWKTCGLGKKKITIANPLLHNIKTNCAYVYYKP